MSVYNDPAVLGATPVEALENAAAALEQLRAAHARRTNADAVARRALQTAAHVLWNRALQLRCGQQTDSPQERIQMTTSLFGKRPIRAAFCGASGTGKTTLASYVAARFKLPLNPIGARSVAASMGFASPYDVDAAGRRAEFQARLLTEKTAWESAQPEFVTDRSPIDNVTYTALHDVNAITDATIALMEKGLKRYTHLIYCPVTVFRSTESDTARRDDAPYHELFDALLFGLLTRYVPAPRLCTLNSALRSLREQIVYEFLAK